MLGIMLTSALHLLLLETMLPDRDVRGDPILAVVEENDPIVRSALRQYPNLYATKTYIPSGSIDSPIRNS